MELISYPSMLRQMKMVDDQGKPVPFSIQFVTADRRRKTSGEIITIKSAILPSARKKSSSQRHRERLEKIRKAPDHEENGTANIYAVEQMRTVKVHLRLITSFNNCRVVY